MIISKNSWHFELFKFADRNKYEKNSNICKYTRGVLAGMFLSMMAVLISALVILVLMEPFVSLAAYLLTGISFIPFFGTVLGLQDIFLVLGMGTWIVIVLLGLVFLIIPLYTRFKNYVSETYKETKVTNVKVQKTASFFNVLRAQIKSKHDKFCLNIQFNNEK